MRKLNQVPNSRHPGSQYKTILVPNTNNTKDTVPENIMPICNSVYMPAADAFFGTSISSK